jgi:hypothetical protein
LDDLTEQHALARFRELVLADRTLHDQLRAAPSDADFLELTVRLATERGCTVSAAALQRELNQRRRAWLERWL